MQEIRVTNPPTPAQDCAWTARHLVDMTPLFCFAAPMTILLLDLGKELRGGQRQVLYLALALRDSPDFTPLIAAPEHSPLLRQAAEQGIESIALPPARWQEPLALWKLLRLARTLPRPLCIHTQDARAASLGAMLARLAPGALLLHTRRVSYPVSPGWRGAKYRQAHHIAAVSAETAGVLIAGGVTPERIRVIHSGIDPGRYAPAQPHDGPYAFVIVGALTEQKGHATLLRAAALLAKEELPPWRVRIVGAGPLETSLRALAADLGLDGLVEFCGRQDSAAVLPLCDAVVVPSVGGEGSSATIKEAWAVGLPLICSDLASNLELATPDKDALVFANKDAQGLARDMATLLRRPDVGAALRLEGSQTLRGFTHTRMAEAYMELYKQLASNCKNKRAYFC